LSPLRRYFKIKINVCVSVVQRVRISHRKVVKMSPSSKNRSLLRGVRLGRSYCTFIENSIRNRYGNSAKASAVGRVSVFYIRPFRTQYINRFHSFGHASRQIFPVSRRPRSPSSVVIVLLFAFYSLRWFGVIAPCKLFDGDETEPYKSRYSAYTLYTLRLSVGL